MALALCVHAWGGTGCSMTWLWGALAAGGGLALAGLGYWQLIVAEGAYLGPRVVAKTYDWVASRYDGIKQFNAGDDRRFLARPILAGLKGVVCPRVLDVATGTGRLPLALLEDGFAGQIVGLDLSLGMLRQAHSKLKPFAGQVQLVWQDAADLPFGDASFDAVTCLEALEFLPKPLEALSEMVRVLAPGGVLLVTNRVGREARLLPGRALPRYLFDLVLVAHPLHDLAVRAWQVSYDLALARKEGAADMAGQGGTDLVSVLRCPGCGGGLLEGDISLSCAKCDRRYPVRDGIIHLNWPSRPYVVKA
jgi:ubiquinone/menaquinone biosynthesis C-methylase UbiE